MNPHSSWEMHVVEWLSSASSGNIFTNEEKCVSLCQPFHFPANTWWRDKDYRFIRLHVFCVVVADIVYKCYNTAPDPVSSKNNLQYRKYLHTIIISYSYSCNLLIYGILFAIGFISCGKLIQIEDLTFLNKTHCHLCLCPNI